MLFLHLNKQLNITFYFIEMVKYSKDVKIKKRLHNIYSPEKETQHVKKYNLIQMFNIILNTEKKLHYTEIWQTGCSDFNVIKMSKLSH